jgi:medium-chain acyl-[acyl-carrier-protein] hydrolase
MAEPAPPHRQLFRVPPREAGEGDALALPVALCGFLQVAADRDADLRGFGMRHLRAQGFAWMLHRLVVEVAAWPKRQEEVAVVTWPMPFGGAIAERAFAVEGEGGRLLAQAASRWALVDLRARRAVRLPDFLLSFPVPGRRAEVRMGPVPTVPRDAVPVAERRLEVRDSDLDLLGHANNTRYLAWGLEAVADDWQEAHELVAFDVSFRREALRGDILTSRTFAAGDHTLAHALVRAEDTETLATLETRWRAR